MPYLGQRYSDKMYHTGRLQRDFLNGNRAPSQYPKIRLFVRSREVSKRRDWYFKLSYRFEIWQAHRQQCCRSACQIWCDRTILNTNLAASRLYEILRKDVFSDIETGPCFLHTVLRSCCHGHQTPLIYPRLPIRVAKCGFIDDFGMCNAFSNKFILFV